LLLKENPKSPHNLALLIGPEFDEFLCAPIGADRNGTGLSVLSALARLNVDPWQEATSLARMPREAAVVRLTALIDAPPNEGTIGIPTTIAADLVALLPRGNSLNVRSSVRLFAPAGPRQTRILMALSDDSYRLRDLSRYCGWAWNRRESTVAPRV
jgi:hypothetical protein